MHNTNFHSKIHCGKCIVCKKQLVFLKNKQGKDIRCDEKNITKEDFRFDSIRHHIHRCDPVDVLVESMGMKREDAEQAVNKQKEQDKIKKELLKAGLGA